MILSKNEVIEYFKRIKSEVPRSNRFVFLINSHLNALDKIEKLEVELKQEREKC